MIKQNVCVFMLAGAILALSAGTAIGYGVDCFRLKQDGTCGTADQEEPPTLECCKVYYPSWVVTPSNTYVCEEAVGVGREDCTESVTNSVYALIQWYDGCSDCLPDADGVPQRYGQGCLSSELDGDPCPA